MHGTTAAGFRPNAFLVDRRPTDGVKALKGTQSNDAKFIRQMTLRFSDAPLLRLLFSDASILSCRL